MTEPSPPQIPDELRPYLDTIADRLLSGHAAVMIGAGFSKNAAPPGSPSEFPDWAQLGDRFYQRLHGHAPGPKDRYLQVPTLAHQVEAAFGRPALDRMLLDAIPDLQHEPSPLHVALLDLPWSDVFTTNYDTLLERARRSVISQRYDVVLKPDDLGHSNRPRIVKLHGSLPSERPFIITDEDYRRYPQDFAPFVNAVRQTLLENTLCLVGFSGDDPNFLQWVGWIRDNLGPQNVPKMYLVGVLDLSPSQRTLLEQRNIIPVDLSECPGNAGDYHQALRRFLDYLESRRVADSQLDWPEAGPKNRSDDTRDVRQLVDRWRDERRRYPGWVVLPEDLRRSLWRETSHQTREMPAGDTLPGTLDLEFAFELTWRMDKCLCPIFDNQVQFLEATTDRYWPLADPDASLESLPPNGTGADATTLTSPAIRRRCHYVLLSMLRYYREEGLSAKWNDACTRLLAIRPALSPEDEARLCYERALFALFALSLEQLKTRLADWPRNDALPFWTAKRAGLLAEIGRLTEARRLLEHSLNAIRAKLNLTPTRADYTLVSQESFVMYLLQAVRLPLTFTTPDDSDIRRQRHEFRERWHVLKQYKCDPWQELETFEHSLQRPPTTTLDTTKRPAFDIGWSIRTSNMGPRNTEALAAYNFLHFCEDAGIPFRLPGCTIATKTAAGTLRRIAEYSSYWALATLVRIDDTKAVDEIFDRFSLARMNTPTVDGLIDRYLESLRLAAPDITAGDRRRGENFGTLLAGVLPEILSRLCCKCSRSAREKLLDWLLDVYRSDHKSNYRGIGHLMRRLLEGTPVPERVAMVDTLLQFPIPTDLHPLEEREYINPFSVLELPKESLDASRSIAGTSLNVMLDATFSDKRNARCWSVATLGRLYQARLLDEATEARFAEGLWTDVDAFGLPRGTDYYQFVFLSLPHPAGTDPVACFMRYVRGARFPAQESETSTRIEMGGGQTVGLCHNILAATDVRWSKKDARTLVHRLVQWWDTDKLHWRKWRRAPDKSSAGIRDALGERLADLVMTLAAMVVRHPGLLADDDTRIAVTRVAAECAAEDVPVLLLDVARAYALKSSLDFVLHRVESAMASPRRESVVDAFRAMDLVSRHVATESDGEQFTRLLRTAGQMVRWQRGTLLGVALGAVGEAVGRHPWAFVDDVERWVLTRLGHLVTETTVKNGDEHAGTGNEWDVSTKLLLRQASARLAYRLFKYYRARGGDIPESISVWQTVCRSDDEFLEIRNQWLAPEP